MHRSSTLFTFLFLLFTTVYSQRDWSSYACESLICDAPKKCVVQDQVAQCLLIPTPNPPDAGITLFPTNFGFQSTQPPNLGRQEPQFTFPPQVPSTQSPFGSVNQKPDTLPTMATLPNPFLNLFGGPSGPLVFPTLPPPSTTTARPPIDICQLPPLTGSCNRARIMWYYDSETGHCERFSFSGCGNENRFPSRIQCEQTCIKQLHRRKHS